MEYLTIGGQKRPIRGNIGVIRKFAAKKGVKDLTRIDEALGGLSFDDLYDLIYLLLQSGAKAEGLKFEVSTEDVSDWLDEMDFDGFTEISSQVMDSIAPGKDQEPPPAQTPKK